LKMDGTKAVSIKGKAALVHRIFTMSKDGKGIFEITKTLNAEGVLHSKGHWRTSHVAYLLANRSVLGEFQPHTGKHPNRKPTGPPIPDYYPRVIEDELFYSVREGLDDRRTRKPGRPGKEKVYLFSGLMNDGRKGGTVTYCTIGLKNSGVKLIPSRALDYMPGEEFITFPSPIFETEILKALTEVKLSDVMPTEEGAGRMSELAGRLADTEHHRDQIKARIKAHPEVDSLYDVLKELNGEVKERAAELAAERQRRMAGTMGEAWGEVQSLATVAADADNDTRIRIRTALRRVIDAVWVVFMGRHANWKGAAVQVFFKGGAVRTYAISHKFKHRTRPAITTTVNIREENPDGLDLRKADTREDVVALLELCVMALAERTANG
jgi:hypothetical protein